MTSKASTNRANIVYKALAAGSFKVTRSPGLIPIYTLENHYPRCKHVDSLVKAITFSMCRTLPERITEEWRVLLNATPKSEEEFKYIGVYSLLKNPTEVRHLVAVDFSILNNDLEKERLFEKYPTLKTELLRGLNRICKKGLL